MSLPDHQNKCVCCDEKIEQYGDTINNRPAPAFCNNCDGYPCYCEDHGAFIVKKNPRHEAVKCPVCGSLNASVQVDDDWW